MKQGGTATLECLEIDRFIVWGAILPTPREDANPRERQRAHGGVVCCALRALRLGRDLRPEGMPERGSGPLHEGVAEACRALEAPVDPALRATTCCHRGHAGALVECGGGRRAVAVCADGDEEPGSADGASPWRLWNRGKSGWLWAHGVLA